MRSVVENGLPSPAGYRDALAGACPSGDARLHGEPLMSVGTPEERLEAPGAETRRAETISCGGQEPGGRTEAGRRGGDGDDGRASAEERGRGGACEGPSSPAAGATALPWAVGRSAAMVADLGSSTGVPTPPAQASAPSSPPPSSAGPSRSALGDSGRGTEAPSPAHGTALSATPLRPPASSASIFEVASMLARRAFWPSLLAFVLGSLLRPWVASGPPPRRLLAARGASLGSALGLALRRSRALTRRIPFASTAAAPLPLRVGALAVALGWLAPLVAAAAERRRHRAALWDRMRSAQTYVAWREAAEAALGEEDEKRLRGGRGVRAAARDSPAEERGGSDRGGRSRSGARAPSRRARRVLACAAALDEARERRSIVALQSLLLSQARPCATACAREAAHACDVGLALAPPPCVREYERAWRMSLCWLLECAAVPWRVGVDGVREVGEEERAGEGSEAKGKAREEPEARGKGATTPIPTPPSGTGVPDSSPSAPALDLASLHAFLSLLSHRLGSTALVLSGGGSFGQFHFGMILALGDLRCVPRVASGSSAGSFGASLLCSRSPRELQALQRAFPGPIDFDLLHNAPGAWWARDLIKAMRGHPVKDDASLRRSLRDAFGDTTLAEAQKRSGRRLAVTVSPSAGIATEPRLLQALAAPDVLVRSAVAASCAFPLLFLPQPLLCKRPHGVSVGIASGEVLEMVEEQEPEDGAQDGRRDDEIEDRTLSAEDGTETPRGYSRDCAFADSRATPPRLARPLHSPPRSADPATRPPLTSNVVAAPAALLRSARERPQGEEGRCESSARRESCERGPGEASGAGKFFVGDSSGEEEEEGGDERRRGAPPSSAVQGGDLSKSPSARLCSHSPLRTLLRTHVSHRNLAVAPPRSPPPAPRTPTAWSDVTRVPELWRRSPAPRPHASPGASPLSLRRAAYASPRSGAVSDGERALSVEVADGKGVLPVKAADGKGVLPVKAADKAAALSAGLETDAGPSSHLAPPPLPPPSLSAVDLSPPLFEHPDPPVEDLWRDGSLELDIPIAALAGSMGVARTIVSQVNPWTLPLLAARRIGGRALASELRLRGRQASLLASNGSRGRLGRGVRLVGAFLSQPWEGDVTIALPPTLLAPHRAATNLSGDEKSAGVAEARHLAWARGAAAIATVMLEQSLEEAVRRVEREIVRERYRRGAGVAAASPREASASRTDAPRPRDPEIEERPLDVSPPRPPRPHTSLGYPTRFADPSGRSSPRAAAPRPHTSLEGQGGAGGIWSDGERGGVGGRARPAARGDGARARFTAQGWADGHACPDPARSPLFSTSRPPPSPPRRLFSTGSGAGSCAAGSPSWPTGAVGSDSGRRSPASPAPSPSELVPLWRQGAKATLPCPELPLGWSPRWSDAEADERMKECGWGSVRSLAQAPWDYDRTEAIRGWEDEGAGTRGGAQEGSSEEPASVPLGPPTAREEERAERDARAIAEVAEVIRGDVWDP